MIPNSSAVLNPELESATRLRTRNRILDATLQLLTEGERLATSSVHRIAKTAGISRATFYLHFKSKHDLIAALAQREVRPWIEMTAQVLSDAAVDREGLKRVAQGVVDVYRSKRAALAGIIEMAESDDETRQAWRETIHSIAEEFQAAIARRRPNLSEKESQQLALMIAWGGERYLHQEVGGEAIAGDEAKNWTLIEMAWKLMND